MNRRALERRLRRHGCLFHHHGGRHDVWINPENQAKAPVPRHPRLKKGTARGICRILGIPLPSNL
ncbi:MAG: type II toxin-antitoxin system HicA family toxin [Planctomycetaceae bacterium]